MVYPLLLEIFKIELSSSKKMCSNSYSEFIQGINLFRKVLGLVLYRRSNTGGITMLPSGFKIIESMNPNRTWQQENRIAHD